MDGAGCHEAGPFFNALAGGDRELNGLRAFSVLARSSRTLETASSSPTRVPYCSGSWPGPRATSRRRFYVPVRNWLECESALHAVRLCSVLLFIAGVKRRNPRKSHNQRNADGYRATHVVFAL